MFGFLKYVNHIHQEKTYSWSFWLSMQYALILWYIANSIFLTLNKSSQLNVQLLGDIR